MELLNLETYKAEIHRTLISKLDLEKLSRVNSSQARQAVSGIVKEIMADQRVPLSYRRAGEDPGRPARRSLRPRPAGAVAARSGRSPIFSSTTRTTCYWKRVACCSAPIRRFGMTGTCCRLLTASYRALGRRVDESSPMVDARLPDGSRVNAIIPPLALDGPSMSIRRFGTGPLAANQLVKLNSISAEMMEVLSAAVSA